MENQIIRTIIGIVTLGISEIVNAVQLNKKCAWEYIYQPKGKNKCCKWRNKCALWTKCKEDSKSCKKAHNNNEDPCTAKAPSIDKQLSIPTA